eukprot:CAMPEP_0194166986 /NCGR_PEP_ID=MMETSP0154-20130528/2433_1 /TAXON_ID=1049557 /ORGANISM="Thalassiothrix antarctica, Strain L6-D1" /LENGTH=427 /DNA_ID=CAMNT_0038877803 /DNA_START=367 /DNA_END=1647 /DNA_ORIENTATION=-
MATFYHGREPNHPSQIKLLCSASYTYRRLFDTTSSIATKKTDTTSSVSSITLKTELSRDKNRIYHTEIDINSLDLEKKFMTTAQLISGRQLLETAKRGIKSYKKALSFAASKWNLKTDSPIESGTTEDDVMQYVRERMFKLSQKNDDNTSSDEDDIGPDTNDSVIDGVGVTGVNDSVGEAIGDKDGTNDEEKDDKAESVPNNDEWISDSDGEEPDVPDDYIFASYFAFIAWGPFAPINERLEILLTIDDKKVEKSTNATRKVKERKKKDSERAHDSSTERGFSTDQRINIEQLRVQKMSCIDRKNEAVMFNLAIEESALARQVEVSETRAQLRCPEYDDNNLFWKKANAIIKKHEQVMDRISNLNSQCDPVSYESSPKVSEFLNGNSPRKRDNAKRNNDGLIMLDSDTSDDDTASIHKKSKVSFEKE